MSTLPEPMAFSERDKRPVARLMSSTLELFKLFLKRGPALGWVKDQSGQFTFINQQFGQNVKTGSLDLVGRTDFDWLPKGLAQKNKEHDEAVLNSDNLLEFVESLPNSKGEFREWLVFKFPLTDEGGNSFVGSLAADVHERRIAERRLATQYSVTRAFTDANSLREVTPKFLEALCTSFHWDVGALWLTTPGASTLSCLGMWHPDTLSLPRFEETSSELHLSADIGLPEQVLTCEAPAYLNDISTVTWSHRAQIASQEGLRSAFGYPLRADNEIVGVVEFYSRQSKDVVRDLLTMLDALSSQIAQFIKRKQAEEELALSNELLQALSRAQSQFIIDGNVREVFGQLLSDIMHLTGSKFGFIGEVEVPQGAGNVGRQLTIHAVAKFAPGSESGATEIVVGQEYVKQTLELESHTEASLIDLLLTSRRPIIYNRQPGEALRSSRAEDRPSASFLGLPVFLGHRLVGVVALANRTFGYDEALVHSLKPFLSTCAIILEAHQNNQIRRLAEEALKENENRLSAILDVAADGIITVTAGGIIESINLAADAMFRYRTGELVGRPFGLLLPDLEAKEGDDEGLKKSRYLRRELLKGLHEAAGHRKDRTKFPAEISVSEVHLSEEVIYSIIVRDISERKEIEKRVTEFYSTVSHELRTPLTSIRGSLGLIEGGVLGQTNPAITEYLQIARASCDRLIGLINDILDIRKIEANKLELKLEPTAPTSILKASTDSVRAIAEQRGIRIILKDAANSEISVDGPRIVQIITNLLSNAVKFSESGSEIVLSTEDVDESMVRFAVIDQGPGIAPGEIKKLFSKFQQLDSSDTREKGGTGLGLAISKSLVELHKGAIGVESKVGEGSTFWFEVPACKRKQS
jgi:PAS domain S-box-containing protein